MIQALQHHSKRHKDKEPEDIQEMYTFLHVLHKLQQRCKKILQDSETWSTEMEVPFPPTRNFTSHLL